MLVFAVWLWTVGGRQIPVDVIGELPEKDVAAIIAGVKRDMRREIMPDFSLQSLRRMPGALKRYSSIKLFTVASVKDMDNCFIIITWSTTNNFSRSTFSNSFLRIDEFSPNPQSMISSNNAEWFMLIRGLEATVKITNYNDLNGH